MKRHRTEGFHPNDPNRPEQPEGNEEAPEPDYDRLAERAIQRAEDEYERRVDEFFEGPRPAPRRARRRDHGGSFYMWQDLDGNWRTKEWDEPGEDF